MIQILSSWSKFSQVAWKPLKLHENLSNWSKLFQVFVRTASLCSSIRNKIITPYNLIQVFFLTFFCTSPTTNIPQWYSERNFFQDFYCGLIKATLLFLTHEKKWEKFVFDSLDDNSIRHDSIDSEVFTALFVTALRLIF